MSSERVILVDNADRPLGAMEKLQAHREGALHRAFSVFVVNSRGQLMLQRRAFGKYHSPGLWSNTCCGHPRPEEDTAAAARRRLKEEMGIECELTLAFSFSYKATLANGLTEHEFDHVFVGHYEGDPVINREEAADWRYQNIDELAEAMRLDPDSYTYWFRHCFARWRDYMAGSARLESSPG